MDLAPLTVVIALAVLLVGIAVYVVYSQQRTLAQLRASTGLSREDRRYLYRQVVRRLFSAVLWVMLAAFLVGWIFLEPTFDTIQPREPDPQLTDADKETLRLMTMYVIGGVLVLMLVMVLAVYDLLATARFGARHRRQLIDDRREALHEEVERILRDRHGLNGESRH